MGRPRDRAADPRQSSTDAKKSGLLAKNAVGGFSQEVRTTLQTDPGLATEIAARLLESHFPESIQADILAAVGLTLGVDKAAAKKRDPQIRWFQAGVPDVESNGLALCVLHHKTFDLGAFTVNREGVLLVSDQAHGTEGFHEVLMSRHGKPVRPPQRQEWKPAPASLDWHTREVFKGAARTID